MFPQFAGRFTIVLNRFDRSDGDSMLVIVPLIDQHQILDVLQRFQKLAPIVSEQSYNDRPLFLFLERESADSPQVRNAASVVASHLVIGDPLMVRRALDRP